jgi:hypothetical protein
MMIPVVFATPRKLPKANQLQGRVVVLDIAFASESAGGGFEGVTLKFIRALDQRLAMWIDHHDSAHHAQFTDDPRFVLHKKSEYGACPPLVTPARVQAAGAVDVLVCHTDFDGIAAAAKWRRGGIEPYVGCDADAVAIDSCIGSVSPIGQRLDRALRIDPKDEVMRRRVLDLLSAGETDSLAIQAANQQWQAIEEETERLAGLYRPLGKQAVVCELPVDAQAFDKTLLLLKGQALAEIAVLLEPENISIAAGFNSGYNFLQMFGLSGGMPTRVSLRRGQWAAVLQQLG